MKSLNSSYFSRIDHLRFFAATLVIFHHFSGNIAVSPDAGLITNFFIAWLKNGSTGVSLFLFLTGFLFCIISDIGNKKINYKGFIYNRILRIFPLLIVLVAIVIAINRANSTPMDIFRVLTLQLNTGNPGTGWGHEFFPVGPIWTISVEFQFYLIFPFLALFLKRYGLKYLLGIVLLSVLIRINVANLVPNPMYWNFYHTILGRLDQFVIGMIFAVLWNRGYLNLFHSYVFSIFLTLISFTLLTYLFTLNKDNPYVASLLFSIEALLWGGVVCSYFLVGIKFNNLLDTILSKLGEISFSLYLIHLPVGMFVNKLLGFVSPNTLSDSLLQSCVRMIPIILISMLMFNLIEKPFMSLRVKYTS